MQLKSSAPGSLMLLGEYAVLYGKQALVCAVDKRINVTLTPRHDKQIIIRSAAHGEYVTYLADLNIEKPFQFVLGALKQYQPILKRGCEIDIVSTFSDKIGLGSSAAVTVAVLAGLVSWLNVKISPIDLVRQGRNIVRYVQGVGSGADIAASVFGGIVAYQAQPTTVEKFALSHPLTVLYSGFKTPTVDAIKRVQTYFSDHPNLFRHLCHSIGQCAAEGILLLRKENWTRLGEIMSIQQGMMESLRVSTPLLRSMVDGLQQQSSILGAKISGSGLGDCIVGLGSVPEPALVLNTDAGVSHVPVEITGQGVYCEKI